MKYCIHCDTEKELEEFGNHHRYSDGKQPWCKTCRNTYMRENYYDSPHYKKYYLGKMNAWNKTPNGKLKKRQSRISIRQATPSWNDMDKMAAWYELASLKAEDGTPREVDHIIPIKGKLVCGLNVHNNLQILTKTENLRKGNRYEC